MTDAEHKAVLRLYDLGKLEDACQRGISGWILETREDGALELGDRPARSPEVACVCGAPVQIEYEDGRARCWECHEAAGESPARGLAPRPDCGRCTTATGDRSIDCQYLPDYGLAGGGPDGCSCSCHEGAEVAS